jgi:phosphohistidine phosphatase
MRLFFLRHAVAYSREEWSGSEADRPLTDRGRAEMRLAADGLATLDLKVELVITSPFARAAVTARIAVEALHVPLEEADELSPGATLSRLLHVLQAHEDVGRILLVGHEPDFSRMIGELMAAPHPAILTLKKAGCARVDVPTRLMERAIAANDLFGRGTLEWLLTPRQLIRIGGHQPLAADAVSEAKHT